MAGYWGPDSPEEEIRNLLSTVEAAEDHQVPHFANVEFLNLHEDKVFEKVQCRRGGVARQILDDAVVKMKATFSPAQLSEIKGWVRREPEAARLFNDSNEDVVLRQNEYEGMNLANNYLDQERGAVPLPVDHDGQTFYEFQFYVDLSKVYEGPRQPVFQLAKTDTAARNRFQLRIQLIFIDRGPSVIFDSPVFRCRTKKTRPREPTVEPLEPPPSRPRFSSNTAETRDPSPESFENGMSPSPSIPILITDSLMARTARINDLVFGRMTSSHADIAYHLKIKDDEIRAELEEGDVVGFYLDEEDGGTCVKLLRSDNVEKAVHAGVVSRSCYLEANKPSEGSTDTVCVIGIVDVKVIGSVENGERIYASLDRPGRAVPQSHLPVGCFLRRKHVLLGMSMERKHPKSLEEEHLVKCFVCIVLDIGRKDVLQEVETVYEMTEKSTREQIKFASRRAWRRLQCCLAFGIVFLVLLAILLYQVLVPGSLFRYWLCRRGSLNGKLSVSVLPYSSITDRKNLHGIRFSFERLEGKVSERFERNTRADTRKVYYFLNIDRCAYNGAQGAVGNWIGGFKDIGGAKVVSINANCTHVYWHGILPYGNDSRPNWNVYRSAMNLNCSPNPPYE